MGSGDCGDEELRTVRALFTSINQLSEGTPKEVGLDLLGQHLPWIAGMVGRV